MKNKTIILNSVLGIILMFSIAGSFILFYQISTLKQKSEPIENKIHETRNQLQKAKLESDGLAIQIAEFQKANDKLIALKIEKSKAPSVIIAGSNKNASSAPAEGSNKGNKSSTASVGTFKYVKDKDGYTIPYNWEYDYNTWVKAWNSVQGEPPQNIRTDISDEQWFLLWKKYAAEYILIEEPFRASSGSQPPYYGLNGYVDKGWVKTYDELSQRCKDRGCYEFDDGSIYKEGTVERQQRSGYYCTDPEIGLY